MFKISTLSLVLVALAVCFKSAFSQEVPDDLRQGWHILSDPDIMSSDSTVTAMTVALERQGAHRNTALAIRCNRGIRIEVFVSWNQSVGNQVHRGRVRYDNLIAVPASFNPSTNGQTSFLSPELIQTMPNYSRMAIEVITSRQRIAAAFSLIGVGPAIARVKDACS